MKSHSERSEESILMPFRKSPRQKDGFFTTFRMTKAGEEKVWQACR
jgi:hypothetical protein